MAYKVHVVPHVHWDREWYFTAEESKILLVTDMEEILSVLENKEDYPYFVLDGQTAILEDYLALVPENKDRIKKLVAGGKLIIGPWYTQTDEMVVGGESIVRNLLYGLKDCKDFGPPMMIGYLPDSFGQSAAMPQILSGFDIKRCIFWRGTSERMGTDKTEFYWQDANGYKVSVQLLPLGYAIGKYLPDADGPLKERMDKYFPVLDHGAVTEHLILPNGHDQMPIQKNIFTVIDRLKNLYPERDFFLSRYENVFDEIEKEELPVLTGEFLDGKYMRVHRSIYSSRADIKSANTRIENKITNILEPLASIAYVLGFSYPGGMMESIWKEMLKNHAHDSIGCCCSDRVHKAISDRFFLAENRVDSLIQYCMRFIVDAMPEEDFDKLTVFNLLPYERAGVVKAEIITKMKAFSLIDDQGHTIPYEIISKEITDPGLIDRQLVHYGDYDPFIKYTLVFHDTVKAMGYKTYLIQQAEIIQEIPERSSKENVLENGYMKINIRQNGSLEIVDKESGTVYQDVLVMEDGSDDGDGYDYSPLINDFILTSKNVAASVKVTENACCCQATIQYAMAVPKDMESRKNKVCDSTMMVCYKLTLDQNSPVLHITLEINNQSKDHRVRVLLPVGAAARCSVSDNQFGTVKRPVRDMAMDLWEKEGWSERPDSIYPFLSYVTTDVANSLAAVSNSFREYEIIGEFNDVIALTVFRSVGYLGKEELVRRPGRPSGIKMPTPASQMIGKFQYEFGLFIKKDQVANTAKEFLTPFISYNKMPYNAMKLNAVDFSTPLTFSLLSLQNNGLILSALKKAEHDEGLVLRVYNGGEEPLTTNITGFRGEIFLSQLNEDIKNELNETEIKVRPNEVSTFYLTYSEEHRANLVMKKQS